MTVAIALLDSLFKPCHVRDDLRELPVSFGPRLESLRGLHPPTPLHEGHDVDHFVSFAAYVKEFADAPVQIVRIDGYRFTHILGRMVFARRPDGVFDLFFWRRSGSNGRWILQQEPDDLTPLLDLPRGSLWLDQLRELLDREAIQRLGDTRLARQWAAWAWRCIDQHVIRHIDLRRLRSRIRGAVGLDLDILHVLHQRRRHCDGPYWFVIEYNREQRRRAQSRILEREAPSLLPLYWGLSSHKDFDLQLEPKQALQRFAASRGIKPRTWKWLAHSGRRGATLCRIASREFFPWNEERNALEYLDVLAILAPARRPRIETLRQVLSLFSTRAAQPASYAVPIRAFGASLRHVLRLLERASTGGYRSLDLESLHTILAWLSDTDCTELTRSQRQGGWKWLMRQAEQHRLRLQRMPSSNASWEPPVATIETGPYRIVPLASAAAMWEESIAMRHCADRYIPSCENGHHHLFSIRSRCGKRVATVCLSRESESSWSLTAVAGKANSEPSAAVRSAAKELLAEVNREADAG